MPESKEGAKARAVFEAAAATPPRPRLPAEARAAVAAIKTRNQEEAVLATLEERLAAIKAAIDEQKKKVVAAREAADKSAVAAERALAAKAKKKEASG